MKKKFIGIQIKLKHEDYIQGVHIQNLKLKILCGILNMEKLYVKLIIVFNMQVI